MNTWKSDFFSVTTWHKSINSKPDSLKTVRKDEWSRALSGGDHPQSGTVKPRSNPWWLWRPRCGCMQLQVGTALFHYLGPDFSVWFLGLDEWCEINIHGFHLLRVSCLVSPKSSRAASKGAVVGQKFTTLWEWLPVSQLVMLDSQPATEHSFSPRHFWRMMWFCLVWVGLDC